MHISVVERWKECLAFCHWESIYQAASQYTDQQQRSDCFSTGTLTGGKCAPNRVAMGIRIVCRWFPFASLLLVNITINDQIQICTWECKSKPAFKIKIQSAGWSVCNGKRPKQWIESQQCQAWSWQRIPSCTSSRTSNSHCLAVEGLSVSQQSDRLIDVKLNLANSFNLKRIFQIYLNKAKWSPNSQISRVLVLPNKNHNHSRGFAGLSVFCWSWTFLFLLKISAEFPQKPRFYLPCQVFSV